MKQYNNTKNGFFEVIFVLVVMALVAMAVLTLYVSIRNEIEPKWACRPQVAALIEAYVNGDKQITIENNVCTLSTLSTLSTDSPDSTGEPKKASISLTPLEVKYLTFYSGHKAEDTNFKTVDEYFKSKPKQVEALPEKE